MTAIDLLPGVNLAEPRLGAAVVWCTDDFFAAKERLIDPAEPVFIDGKYDDHGKWMDGWESRRRRDGGNDACIVRLGQPGLLQAVEIDTRHFTGNYPPGAALDGIVSDAEVPGDDAPWTEIVPRMGLAGDDRVTVPVANGGPWTHVRLRIYPDGGVARLRLFGRFAVDAPVPGDDGRIDVAAITNGGYAVYANDQHYGRLANLIAPGRGVNMGDGWETRRRREPGHDFGILALGAASRIGEVLVDTAFFKGNFPHRVSLQWSADPGDDLAALVATSADWPELLAPQAMGADAEHRFTAELLPHDGVRFVRLNLFPDGGVSRLRLFAAED